MMKILCQVCFYLKCFDLQHHIILFCPGEFRSGAVLGILDEMVSIQCSCILFLKRKWMLATDILLYGFSIT